VNTKDTSGEFAGWNISPVKLEESECSAELLVPDFCGVPFCMLLPRAAPARN